MSLPRRISYTTMPSKEAMDGMAWDPYSTWRTLAGVKLDKSMAEAGKLSNFQTFRLLHTRTAYARGTVREKCPARLSGVSLARFPQTDDRPGRYSPPQRISSCWEVSPCWERHSTNRSGYRTGENLPTLCLQTFIVAPPASGKGALAWTRRLAEPIHEAMMANYRQRHKVTGRRRAVGTRWARKIRYAGARDASPSRCSLSPVTIPAPACWRTLIEADGIGLICETEADTVSTAIGTEHGHWSDTLRKCHDHERLAFNRRTNREYRECPASYLSVLLSGTPAQVRPLIPSAENGLFSRQLFYRMPPIDEWADQFEQGDEDMDSLFSDWGSSGKCSWTTCVRGSISYNSISDTQKERFNSCFARIFGHAGLSYGYPMRSSVARIAINICRIASVVAFLRSVESLLTPQAILDSQFSILNCPGLSSAPRSRRRTYGTVSFLP